MSLEKKSNEHCDGSCSWMDTIGMRMVPHDEVEREVTKALKTTWSERYNSFMYRFKGNHPQAYNVLVALGILEYR